MKKLILSIFMVLFATICFSKNLDTICKFVHSHVVRVRVKFKDTVSNKIRWEFGRGFIIKGKYLATCYHVVSATTNEKTIYIQVIFNEREINGTLKYDSAYATTNFKAKKNQYDFSKHVYDSTDYETDFRVLKLTTGIKNLDMKIATENPSYMDTLYCGGNAYQNNLMMNVCQSAIFGLNYKEHERQTANFLGCFVTYTDGCSGSPLFNSKGEILGMIQFCMRPVPIDWVKYQYANHKMSADLANKIVAAYQQGLSLQYSIDINFLISHYLRGYID